MPEETRYTCLVEEHAPEAFVQMYWARGTHMGEAIEKVLAAARENNFSNPVVREVDPCDSESPESKGEVYPDPEADVFYSTTRYSFPAEPAFSCPTGIVASGTKTGDDDELEADDITMGFCRSVQEHGLIEIGINVESFDLVRIYGRLLSIHDDYETFLYMLHDHWGNTETQFLEHPKLNSPDAIMAHLNSHPEDSVMNGFVTLTAYVEDGATNLNISEHKRIVVLTYSEKVADAFVRTLEEEGFAEDSQLVSFDSRIHHWHYRPSASRSREELIAHLSTQGFTPWNPDEGAQK